MSARLESRTENPKTHRKPSPYPRCVGVKRQAADEAEVDTICRAVAHLDAAWTSTKLDLLTACSELSQWKYVRQARADYPSLVRDLVDAADTLQDETQRLVGDDVQRLVRSAKQNNPDTQKVTSLALNLLNRLKSGDVCASLWLDVVATARPTGPLQELFDTRNFFATVTGAIGHDTDWSGIGEVISGVLHDERPYVEFLRRATGGNVVNAVRSDQRVQLIYDYLQQPNRPADNIVWLGIDDAMMGLARCRVAQIEFFRGVNLRAAVDHSDNQYGPFPREVYEHPDIFTEKLTGPTDELRYVVARVSLPDTSVSTAMSTAIDLVEAVFTSLGGSHLPGWKRSGVAVQFVDGKPLRRTFRRPEDFPDPNAWRSNPISAAIRDLRPEMFNGYLEISPEYQRTIDYVRGYNSKDSRSIENRIAIAVRLLENVRSASFSTDEWWEFASSQFKARWVWSEIVRDLCEAVEAIPIPDVASNWLVNSDDVEALGRASRTINALLRRRGRLQIESIASTAVEIRRLLKRSWLPMRIINDVLQIGTSSSTKRNSTINRRQHRFDVFLGRLRRYRNLAAHGGSLDTPGIEIAEQFVTDLATLAAHSHIKSVEDADRLDNVVHQERLQAEDKLDKTRAGTLPKLA